MKTLRNLAIVGMTAFLLIQYGVFIGRRSVLRVESGPGPSFEDYPYQNELNSRDRYLNLLKLTLCDVVYDSPSETRGNKAYGKIWPVRAYTMIGLKRLDNL